jgi:ribose-phosphate pyrophosphokinase
MPFMSYMRQDRKDEPRTPISAKLVANVIGLNRLVQEIFTYDMHSDQLTGFYDIPIVNIPGHTLFLEHVRLKYQDLSNLVISSTDVGGLKRVQRFAKDLGDDVTVAGFDKRRNRPNEVEGLRYIGEEIRGKDLILFDDIIDTAGSITKAGKHLSTLGARSVELLGTHGLFSKPERGASALERINQAGFPIVVADSNPRVYEYATQCPGMSVVPIKNSLADAIEQAQLVGGSVNGLYRGRK